jgi:hypothetical protein
MRTSSSSVRTRKLARRAIELGDDGSNHFLVREVPRTNKLQAGFLSEHLVKAPLVEARKTVITSQRGGMNEEQAHWRAVR